jgi:hypothetical protein
MKAAWYLHKVTQRDQQNRIECSEMISCIDSQLTHQTICWRKSSLFNKWYWENWIFTWQKAETWPLSLTPHKSQLKMFKYLLRYLKLSEENIRETLQDINRGNNFLDKTPKSTWNKSKNRVTLYQTPKLYTAERTNSVDHLPMESKMQVIHLTMV